MPFIDNAPMSPPYVKFCPGCDKAYAEAGFKTHCRSKKHKLALYAYDQRMVRILVDVLLKMGGKVSKDEKNEFDPLESLGDDIAIDRVEIELETIHGKLTVHPVRGATIFCRFEDAKRASVMNAPGFRVVNPFSGKYNFHYHSLSLEHQHIEHFLRDIRRLACGNDNSPSWDTVYGWFLDRSRDRPPYARGTGELDEDRIVRVARR